MLPPVRRIFLDLDATLCHYELSFEEACRHARDSYGLGHVDSPRE